MKMSKVTILMLLINWLMDDLATYNAISNQINQTLVNISNTYKNINLY